MRGKHLREEPAKAELQEAHWESGKQLAWPGQTEKGEQRGRRGRPKSTESYRFYSEVHCTL